MANLVHGWRLKHLLYINHVSSFTLRNIFTETKAFMSIETLLT